MAGTKGVWGKPLSTAVRAAPQPAAQLESPPRPKGSAARPGPAPATGPPQAEAAAKPLLVPAAKGPLTAHPAQVDLDRYTLAASPTVCLDITAGHLVVGVSPLHHCDCTLIHGGSQCTAEVSLTRSCLVDAPMKDMCACAWDPWS